jgi:hypothetical protein
MPNNIQTLSQSALNTLVEQIVKANVQNSLNAAVATAIDMLVKSLPQRGFESVFFNSGWEEE